MTQGSAHQRMAVSTALVIGNHHEHKGFR